MEEENGGDLSPFWVQSSGSRHRGRRLRQGLSSFFLSSGLLVFLLLVMAVAFLVFVVPSTISLSSQIFRPNYVKKSWDSLNLVLVVVALVFGFLSRNKNEDRKFDEDFYQTTSPVPNVRGNETPKSSPSTPQGWYGYSSVQAENSSTSSTHLQGFGYSDQTAYYSKGSTQNSSRGGLRRTGSSNSYPDLLHASSKLTLGTGPWLCYDDMRINTTRLSDGQLHRRRNWKHTFDDPQPESWKYTFDNPHPESKGLYEDTFMVSPQQPPSITPTPPTPPPAPPSPPPASMPLDHEKPMIASGSVGRKRERMKKRRDNQLKHKEPISEPVTTLPSVPPAPPPPPPLPEYVEQKRGKSDKKRSGGNATKDFLNSLYHKKKKKQRQKSIENLDALLHQPQTPTIQVEGPQQSRPPPPPPMPPPPSAFHNLFSTKKSKRKTTATVISVPIPPPKAFPRPKPSKVVASSSRKPRQPVKVRSFDSEEGNSNSGGESPHIRIPPPPPPPPPPPFLKSPAWKFVVQGDFVRLDSFSSRSGSPEPDEELESIGTPTASDAGDSPPIPASALFFPSPDVNTKADNFISRFRAGLQLEKVNSMNKRVGLSNLGPGSGPSQS